MILKELNQKQIEKLRDGIRQVVRSRDLRNLTSTSGVVQYTVRVSDGKNVKELISKSENIIADFFDGKELAIKEVDVSFLSFPMAHRLLIECRGKR